MYYGWKTILFIFYIFIYVYLHFFMYFLQQYNQYLKIQDSV